MADEMIDRILAQLSAESSWADIGAVAMELEEAAPVDSRGVLWTEFILARLEDMGRKIAAQQLRKIRRCYAFLLLAAKVDPRDYSTCPLAGIEVVSKIHPIDAEEARRQLGALRNGVPYLDVLQAYERLREGAASQQAKPSSVSRLSTRKRSQASETLVMAWIEREASGFFGATFRHFFTIKPPRAQFQTPDLMFRYALHGSDAQLHMGVEVKSGLSASPRAVLAAIAELNLRASFYDRFWLILTEARDDRSISSALDALRVFNVGVAIIDLEGNHKIIRAPVGLPSPDRRDLLDISGSAR